LPEDILEDLLGDVVSDGLGRCLAATLGSHADLEALRAIALKTACTSTLVAWP
jgi:hypothetical protein